MKRKTVFVGLLVILNIPSCLRAQTGSITGTVFDPSGAVILKAKVTALNVATGASRSAETDESGVYRITNLDPGTYDITFEHSGFKPFKYSEIPISVDQVLSLDVKLSLGPESQQVRVTSNSVPPIDLNDAQIGNLVDSRQIEGLPLILRDPYQLVLLSPGTIQTNTLFSGFSVNGSRERSNNFMLDGADNNDPDMGGFPGGLSRLNPENTQEFRVLTNNYLPEFGRNNGAIIDIVTKQGTNNLHADVYWFGRYTALSAKDFFAQDRNQDPFARNQVGYSVSGPIQKNKTFFFANEEIWRFSTTLLKTSIVPTAAFKTGVFTYTSNGQSANVDVSTPNSPNNGTNFGAGGLPLDPLMQQILAVYPNPNATILDGARGLLHFPSRSLVNSNNVTGRIDHSFSEQAILSVRYTFNQYSDSNYQHEDFLSGTGGVSTKQHNHNLTARLTSTATRGLINELHLAFNRLEFPLNCTGANLFDSSSNGLDPVGRGKDVPLTGSLAGFGCIFLGDTSSSTRNAGTYTAGDNISWVRGRHTLKTGAEYRGVYSNSSNNFASRTITDSGVFSSFGIQSTTGTGFEPGSPFCSPPSPPQQLLACLTLQNLVWQLFGGIDFQTQAQFFDSSGTRTATDERGFRQREFAGYAQDSYKIIPNLTFSYGVRYEFFGVPVEVQNRLSTLLVAPDGPGPFTFTQVGESSGRTPLYQDDWKNIEPRASVAWDPIRTGKTSIRAGYGLYHDRVFGLVVSLLRGDPPFQMLETQVCPGFFVGAFQACTLSALSPLPTFPDSPTVNNCPPPGQPCSPILPFLVDSHLRTPYSQSWSAGIQIGPYPSLLLDANYVGSKGTHLLRLVDGNPPQPDRLAQYEAFCVPRNPNNAMLNTPTGQCDQTTLQFTNLWLGVNNGSLPPLFPDGNAVANNSAFLQAELFKGISNSIYHALQLNVTKRMSHGFSLQSAYTYSHAIDDGADPLIPINNNILFPPYPRNSFSLRAERGNSEFDVTHRLALNYSWQLPLVRKDHAHRAAANALIGGWTVSGITTVSSGLPLDIFNSFDTQHSGLFDRPDFNPKAAAPASTDPRTQTGPSIALFSTPACFSTPGCFGTGGNLGRNHFRGPGINNSDAVLNKQVGIRERVKLDMRFEFYNLFNRVQFNQPDNLLADTTLFGHSTGETFRPDFTTGARQIQLGMKLSF